MSCSSREIWTGNAAVRTDTVDAQWKTTLKHYYIYDDNGIGIVYLVGFFLRDHALLDGFVLDFRRIDAGTVIRDHDDDVVAFVSFALVREMSLS